MDMAFTLGKMADSMRVSIKMTRSMDMESTLGQIRKNMQGGGMMENNMVWDNFTMEKKELNLEFGKRERR